MRPSDRVETRASWGHTLAVARGGGLDSWRDDIGWCRLIRKKAAEQDFLSLGRKARDVLYGTVASRL